MAHGAQRPDAWRSVASIPEMSAGFGGAEPTLIAVTDLEGFVVSVNPTCTEVLGWSAEEMTAVTWWEFIHPDDQHRLVEIVEDLMPVGAKAGHEARVLRRDGSYRWIRANLRAAAARGQLYVAGRDATGDRPVEQVRVGSWELRADTATISVSESAAALLLIPGGAAVPLEALLGRIPGRDRYRVGRALRWSLRSREPLSEVFRILRPDGSTGRVRMCGRVTSDGATTSRGIRGIVRDLTSTGS